MTRQPRPLTDFVEVSVLRQILRRFATVTGYVASIRDPKGQLIARGDAAGPPNEEEAEAEAAEDEHATDAEAGPEEGAERAEIRVSDRCVAMMWLEQAVDEPEAGNGNGNGSGNGGAGHADGGDPDGAGSTLTRRNVAVGPAPLPRAQAASFMTLLAETIAQLCEQGGQLKSRLDDLSTLFELSTLLSGERDMRAVLDTVAESVVELMGVKASSIRLLDPSGCELLTEAVYNLSSEYLNKGPILLDHSQLDRSALADEVVYIEDMRIDDRVMYPEDARQEGLVSMLCAGMIYRGKPIGVIRLYTDRRRAFSVDRRHLLRAIAQIAAASIRTAQLDAQRREQTRIQRQVQLAADVQRHLLPDPEAAPAAAPFRTAGRYEPCFELGGDFYDYIPLESNLGVVVGDVVGKGVAAGLLMASVRASLRAHVQDVYDLHDVMRRVNVALCQDTRDHEFATVFYGTLDRQSMRLTYCSAGHEPALLLRDGRFTELSVGGMALGIDPRQTYEMGTVDLQPDDVLVLYTDGVPDASNFADEKFGKERLRQAVLDTADQSPREMVNHVLWEVRRFVGLNYRPDDITVVAVRVDDPARAAD